MPAVNEHGEFHRAWLRAVDDPIGRGWALATLLDQLPGIDAVQRAAALAKRLDALVRHGPDPRFDRARAMVLDAEVDHAAPRLRFSLAHLEAATRVAPAGELPVVSEFPPPTPEIAALWRAVHADPDDDGPLAVLADALQGAGDPRGELIALELAPGRDPARLARQRTLIASCGAAWLGALAAVTEGASFERGVLRRLQLSRGHAPSAPIWNRVLDSPILATVTDLISFCVGSEVYARFLTSPALRSLARIDIPDRRSIAALEHAPPSLVHVACVTEDPREVNDLLAALAHHPRVTSIAIAESEFDRLTAAPWFRRLSAVTLGVGTHIRRGLARWAALVPPMTLTLVPEARLPVCSTDYPWGFGITLERQGHATVARVSGEWLLLPLDVLTDLPADLARVEVDHPDPVMADRVRSALARSSVEVVHRPVARPAAVYVPASS